MRPTPIPDDEMFAGHQRVTFSKPEGEEYEEVLPVEVQATIDEEMGLPMLRVRVELEPGDAERLAAGEPFWLTFWGHMPIFDAAMGEPIVDPALGAPCEYPELHNLGDCDYCDRYYEQLAARSKRGRCEGADIEALERSAIPLCGAGRTVAALMSIGYTEEAARAAQHPGGLTPST